MADESRSVDEPVDETVDDAAPPAPPTDEAVAQPTLLARVRALWCQLVSGLG